jgi:hypothetical protein
MNCNYIFYPDMRWISRFSSASRLKNSLIFGAVSQAWLKLWYQKPPYLSLRTLISLGYLVAILRFIYFRIFSYLVTHCFVLQNYISSVSSVYMLKISVACQKGLVLLCENLAVNDSYDC